QFGISLKDEDSRGGASIFDDWMAVKGERKPVSNRKGKYKFSYKIPLDRFNSRNFIVSGELYQLDDDGKMKTIASTKSNDACRFSVRETTRDRGLLKQKGQWIE
ncbi:MAG TPA: hypothetical protein VHA52_11435, partial [Candidatus Babeliaceae bacterium]|nr:hypothetical protein [Candidatus Babeliaceae bacterium]